jgi:hypothetical protein
MKDIYVKPISDVEEFKTLDVITTSDGGDNEPDTDIKFPWS